MLGVAHVLGLLMAIFGVAYLLPLGCSQLTSGAQAQTTSVRAAVQPPGCALAVPLPSTSNRPLTVVLLAAPPDETWRSPPRATVMPVAVPNTKAWPPEPIVPPLALPKT